MKIEPNKQNRITKDTLVLLMGLFYPAIHNYVWRILVGVTGLIGFDFSIGVFDAIVWTIVIGYILLTSRKPTIKLKTLVIFIALILIALLCFAFTEYDYFTPSVLFTLIVGTFSFFIMGSLIDLKRVSYKQLYTCAVVTLIISIIYSIYSIGSKDITLEDNMDFAYKVLPSVLIIISRLFTEQKSKPFPIIFSVVGTIFLVLQGTRGPLLCLAIFVCLMIYKKHGLSKFLIKLGIIVLIVAILLNSQFVQLKLIELSERIDSSGYSSRFIAMILEGDLSDGNGREVIRKVLLEDIRNDPFIIRGMFADRQATIGLVDKEYSMIYEKGTYAHSFWLEMIYEWGVLAGGAILLLVAICVINLIRKSDKSDAHIYMLFVCTGLVHLLLSGSYLLSTNFFFLMGLAVRHFQVKKITITK